MSNHVRYTLSVPSISATKSQLLLKIHILIISIIMSHDINLIILILLVILKPTILTHNYSTCKHHSVTAVIPTHFTGISKSSGSWWKLPHHPPCSYPDWNLHQATCPTLTPNNKNLRYLLSKHATMSSMLFNSTKAAELFSLSTFRLQFDRHVLL